MPRSHRRPPRLAVVPVALAAGLLAPAVTVTGAQQSPPAAHGPDHALRSPEGEAATGDTTAMLAVVQDIVDCLRSKGFAPGDPEVQGHNVVVAGWNPAWDSPAGRADRECAFPVR